MFEWLPQETLETILDHKIAIKGPLTTPASVFTEKDIVQMLV